MLNKFLKDNRLSQKDFACLIGVSQASVSYYLTRERLPKPAVIKKIFEVTEGQVTPNDFYNLTSPQDNSCVGEIQPKVE
ncbi:helix-turn-helix domain-containing protein [Bartonella sp. DGB1]|uniref:helix-turn-helix domain-containing protein n=1 Tax=Bartonella sp. DGB1 TaxID=3239807 RepID=UPI003524104A